MRMPVRSRIGNLILGVIGALYVIAAVSLLVYAVAQTWNAQSLIEWAVQIVLLAAAVVGAFFVTVATENLGVHPMARLSARRHSQPSRRAAAASS